MTGPRPVLGRLDSQAACRAAEGPALSPSLQCLELQGTSRAFLTVLSPLHPVLAKDSPSPV